jgi:hypothetical protein
MAQDAAAFRTCENFAATFLHIESFTCWWKLRKSLRVVRSMTERTLPAIRGRRLAPFIAAKLMQRATDEKAPEKNCD